MLCYYKKPKFHKSYVLAVGYLSFLHTSQPVLLKGLKQQDFLVR